MWEMKPIKINPVDPSFKVISVKHNEKDLNNIPISLRLPISIAGAAPAIPNPKPAPNVLGGALYRFAREVKFNRKFLRGLRAFTHRFCRARLSKIRLTKSDDISFDTWLEHVDQPMSKKKKLRELREKLTDSEILNRAKYEKHSIHTLVKSFIKDESYPSMKYVRVINAREDAFKLLCGPIFALIGERVGKLKEFVKYIPVAERPKVISERLSTVYSKYFSSDYSSFEAHFNKDLMNNCEMIMYKYMIEKLHSSDKRMFLDALSQLDNENKIKFSNLIVVIMAKRMSGEMNTSLGNGFSNLMICLYHAELNNCGKVKIFVEGDDGIMTFARPENAPTEQDFKKNGFIIKLEHSDNLADLSFCGQVFDPDDGIVVTDPIGALIKFGYTRKRYINAAGPLQKQLLKARAQSMLYQYNGCPMLTAFAAKVLSLTRNVTIRQSILWNTNQYERELLRQALDVNISPLIPPEDAPVRTLFARLYKIDIPDQLLFEKSVDALELGCEIDIESICTIPRVNVDMYERRLFPGGADVPLPTIDRNYLDYLTRLTGVIFDRKIYKFSRPINRQWNTFN